MALGVELIDGDAEGIGDGWLLTKGASLGNELGWPDGSDDGRPDKLGLSLGCDVGQSDADGLSDGCPLGTLDNVSLISCFTTKSLQDT